MKKVTIILIAFVLICACTGIGVKALTKGDSDTMPLVNELEHTIQIQANAGEAGNRIDVFYFDVKTQEFNYPDNLCGKWIEGDKLVIQLTDLSDDYQNNYIDIVGDCAEYLRFIEGKYSYNELKKQGETIAKGLSEKYLGKNFSYYVDVLNNKVIVEIPEPLVETIKDNDYIPECAVYKALPSDSKALTGVMGGFRLYNSDSSEGITASACGTYSGNPAILTCGHFTQVNGQTIKHGSSTGNTIGVTTRNTKNAYGDYEFVKITNSSYTITNTLLVGGSTKKVVGSTAFPQVNQVVRFFGYTTNYVSYGEINATGQSRTWYHNNIGITVGSLSRVKVLYGNAQEGDSGGPVFIGDSTNVNYCGILDGRETSGGYVYMMFTPYGYPSANGFAVKTTE